ncbi:DUF3168 domain-containing protein [Akkermansia muciniphila]|nr:DUF3168 domain-containing protein [Akkermansia muciniphila]
MIDLHPVIANMLKPYGRVEQVFPSTKTKFPLITILELSNNAEMVLDGVDRLSLVDWQIDIWDDGKTAQKAEGIAAQVNGAMTAAGFERYFKQQMRDPAIPQRVCMRFRGKLDEKTMIMYRS